MIQMTLAHTADLLSSSFIGNLKELTPLSFQGVSIDTRTLQAGNLFVAIQGSRVDGHDYIEAARQQGAVAAVVSRPVPSSLPQLLVKDTTLALGQLGAAWRKEFNIPLIAVTGSNGKTTLKNMIASILNAACQGDTAAVLATQGTLNNHWGLPLTLARLNKQHRYAVIEMGMNHFGEIAYLTRLAQPTVAVITNAAACHLEGVGSVQGVAKAKGEIFLGLAPQGTAVLNRDDAFFSFWCEQLDQRSYLSFGFHPDAQVTANIQEGRETPEILMHTPKGPMTLHLPLLGNHNILNAMAATAAALAIGIELAAIKAGLEQIQPAAGRLQLHTLANGVNIIDDTYNANPFSLQAAIHTLATFSGKKILVLGDMKELGATAKELHQDAGRAIRDAGIHYLFTFGELSANTSQAFGEGGYHFNEQEKLVEALKPFLHNTTTILVKGSRSMHMEKVVTGLVS